MPNEVKYQFNEYWSIVKIKSLNRLSRGYLNSKRMCCLKLMNFRAKHTTDGCKNSEKYKGEN